MATKRYNNLLPNTDKNDFISDSDAQFTNFNLNQNQRNSGVQLACSKIETSYLSKNEKSEFCFDKTCVMKCSMIKISSEKQYHGNKNCRKVIHVISGLGPGKFLETAALVDLSVLNTFNEASQKSCFSFDKKDSHLIPSENLKDSWKEKKQRKQKDFLNKSTLSLHISAFENITVTDNLVDQDKSSLNKFSSGKRASETLKTHFVGGLTNSMFEIPRQQKSDESTEPEIMQFKASQKLIHPNQENRLESENKNDVGKSEFEKMKEKANTLFQEEKYNEAIKVYSEILQLPDLTPENQAVIYSNRSASNLMLGSKTSLGIAKTDAEKAIKCWPSWWKGYFRLARVYIFQEEWKKAKEMLNQALAMNSELKEIRDELSFVRCKIGEMNRGEKNNPAFAPLAPEEEAKKLCNQWGISLKEYYDTENDAKKIPFFDNILKGHQYRDGIVVPQDYKKAAECYEKAAKLGNPEGMYNLGKLYHEGNGVKRNYSESMKWFLKAANSKTLIMKGSGIAEAQHSIGLNYTEGVGVEQDYRKAMEWYEKAVANGYGPSANNLGNLYKYGLGVEKSAVKAFNYFKFAAENGDPTAMINVADSYFTAEGTESLIPTREYINEGKKWLQLAAEEGDIRAIEELKLLDMTNLFFDTGLNDKIGKLLCEMSFLKNTPFNYERFGKSVEEAAKNGAVSAKEHLEIWKSFSDAVEALKKNNSAKLVTSMAKAIRLNPYIVFIPKIFVPMIEERIITHPNELDTILCYIHIDTVRPGMDKYIENMCKKYPDDECLAEMACCNYLCTQNFQTALNQVKMSLNRHPNYFRFHFWHGRILSSQEPATEECIKAFDAFLAAAPEDQIYVPACYYYKAEYYCCKKDYQKFGKCYEDALAAEKKQLPCFLPYYFTDKEIFELYYMKFCIKSKGESSDLSLFGFKRIESDEKRKTLLLQHREIFIGYAERYGIPNFPRTITETPCTPNPPNWFSSPIKITLADMDPTKDKVYNGCILEVRIIDWPFLVYSIQTKIEDKNGDVNRLAIYNWPETGNRDIDVLEAMKVFRPNVKISIINPYHRKSNDGQNTIRVEGPEFIKIDTSLIDKLCHVCGKEAKSLPSCSGCKMALYCSKECQKHDWIQFNHKGICKHLKKYSALM